VTKIKQTSSRKKAQNIPLREEEEEEERPSMKREEGRRGNMPTFT